MYIYIYITYTYKSYGLKAKVTTAPKTIKKTIFPRIIYRKGNSDVVSGNHCFFGFIGTVTAFFGFLLVYFGFFGTVVTFAFKNQKNLRFFKLLLTKTNKSYDVTKKKTKIARFGFGAHVVSANHCFFVFFGTVTAFFGFLLVYFVFFGTVVTFVRICMCIYKYICRRTHVYIYIYIS